MKSVRRTNIAVQAMANRKKQMERNRVKNWGNNDVEGEENKSADIIELIMEENCYSLGMWLIDNDSSFFFGSKIAKFRLFVFVFASVIMLLG